MVMKNTKWCVANARKTDCRDETDKVHLESHGVMHIQTRQRRIADSAPGAPCTSDLSSLDACT